MSKLFVVFLVLVLTLPLAVKQRIKLRALEYPGNKKDDSMWSGIFTAKSGKIYIGLCTHTDAAYFYEYDPASEDFVHIADLAIFKGERDRGIRTSGKIHVSFVYDPADDRVSDLESVRVPKNPLVSPRTMSTLW